MSRSLRGQGLALDRTIGRLADAEAADRAALAVVQQLVHDFPLILEYRGDLAVCLTKLGKHAEAEAEFSARSNLNSDSLTRTPTAPTAALSWPLLTAILVRRSYLSQGKQVEADRVLRRDQDSGAWPTNTPACPSTAADWLEVTKIWASY